MGLDKPDYESIRLSHLKKITSPTLYSDFIFAFVSSLLLWLQKRGSVLRTRINSSNDMKINASDVMRK